MALRAISVCSGIGGLDLGLRLGAQLGAPDVRTVCYIEREAYAAATLVARMADATLDQAPIWSDLSTFDGRAWRGSVDFVFGGIPCQPHSVAGKRGGADDGRWLWPDFWRLVRDSGAALALVENVLGFRSSGGLGSVLQDLADGGWDAEWLDLGADSVGAPHHRKRIFLLAYAQGCALREFAEREQQQQAERGDAIARHDRAGVVEEGGIGASSFSGSVVAYADGDGREGVGLGTVEHSRGDKETRRHDVDRCSGTLSHRWPPGRDCLCGDWPEEQPKPGIRRGADGADRGFLYRADRLRALGNSVVPQQAAYAISELWRRVINRP